VGTELTKGINDLLSDRQALLGNHHLYFYASSKKKHEVLFSNLKAGLHEGCSALYMASGESVERVQLEMKRFGLNPDNHTIVTGYQWHTPDGDFHADRVAERYSSLIDESLDKGYAGLCVSADVADTSDYLSNSVTPWLRYENALRRTFKSPMSMICAYRTDQVDPNGEVLLQLVRADEHTISAKKEESLHNAKLFLDVVDGEFNDIFGKKAADSIFHYMERFKKIPKKKIGDHMEDLYDFLKLILGDASTVVIDRITEKLRWEIELGEHVFPDKKEPRIVSFMLSEG